MTTTQPTSWRGAVRAQCLTFLCICFFFSSSVSSKSADCPTVPFWFQIGPSPLIINPANPTDGQGPDSGMVRDLVIDPFGSSDQIIYIATDSGGLWKTQDGGATWVPKTDFLPSLNIGAIALDPGNPSIVYAGSGNAENQFASSGAGLYKSSDGGETWVVLGASIFTNCAINRLVLPAPNLLLVASSCGCFRSIDGGQNFGSNPPLYNDGLPIISGNITDLDVDTAIPTTVYVSIWGFGIFSSTDSGATFPAGANIFTPARGAPASVGYITFAQSKQPDRRTMYVVAQLLSGPANTGVFKSVNLGLSWTNVSVNTSDIEVSPVGYWGTVGVDPQDAKRLYVGARALYLVTDGGVSGITAASRIDLSKLHADQHALVFSPPSHVTGPAPTRFYTGTDGGLATTTNSGSSWTLLNGSSACFFGNGSLATILFRKIDIGRYSTANNLYTYGAAQDLGVSVHRPDCRGSPWLFGQGGDGNSVAVDPLDPRHAIVSTGDGTYSTTDGGASGTPSWQQSGKGLTSVNFLMFYDPKGQFVYAAGSDNILYQSADNGNSFTAIRTFSAQVYDLSIATIDSSTIWVGLGDGTVQRTANAKAGSNANWTSIAIAGGPRSPVTGIAVDPANTSQAVAVFRPSGSSTRVAFRTVDNGASWMDISSNLRGVPLNAVVIDPNTSPHAIIVATDTGVQRSMDFGATWQPLGFALPNVHCTSLAIDPSATPSLLRVGTYGRSVFELAYQRIYVDGNSTSATQDGTLENPFHTLLQGLNVPPSGAARFVNIQSGDYAVGPITLTQCATLNALNGVVRIH